MADRNISPEFENQIRTAMAVPDPKPGRLNDLRGQLLAQADRALPRSTSFLAQPTLRWGLVTLFTALVIVLAAGPQNVYAAFQRLVWNIPGIGLVEKQDSIRILLEPVTQKRGDVTVTVEQVYLDETRSVVVYKVDGLSTSSQQDGTSAADCSEQPTLRLPDSRVLASGGELGGGGSSRQNFQIEYPAVPADVDDAAFIIPCLRGSTVGIGLENWEFHLRFIPAGPEFTAFAVIELPTPTAAPEPTSTPARDTAETVVPTEGGSPTPETSSISLSLDRVVQLDDGFILFGGLHWDADKYDFIFPTNTRLLDADGNEVPFDYVHPPDDGSPQPQGPLAIQASGSYKAGPLTLIIEGVRATVPVNADITFDMGGNPYTGPWELNQQIEIAGHTLIVKSVDAVTVDGHPGFEFKMETDGEIEMPMLIDKENGHIGAFGGPPGNIITVGILYDIGWPSFGEITITLENAAINLEGSWEASWMPSGE